MQGKNTMDNMEKELWDAFYGKESKQERCSVLTEAELNKHNNGDFFVYKKGNELFCVSEPIDENGFELKMSTDFRDTRDIKKLTTYLFNNGKKQHYDDLFYRYFCKSLPLDKNSRDIAVVNGNIQSYDYDRDEQWHDKFAKETHKQIFGDALKEGFMSDEDIHNQFSKFEVLDFSKEGEHSGYIELSFPNADEVDYDSSVITGYTIYEDGKVAFDNWFPDDVYNEVAEYVKQHHSEELDEGCGKKKKKALKEDMNTSSPKMKKFGHFNVAVVFPNEKSVGRPRYTNTYGTEVEFYDDNNHEGFGPYGQFVSSYLLDTLLGKSEYSDNDGTYPYGLQLHGNSPNWTVPAETMSEIIDWLKQFDNETLKEGFSSDNELERIWKENMHREPVLETENGVIYLQPSADGKYIEYGTVTNTGLIVQGSVEYDFDMSFYWNLEAVADQIYEENGYPKEELDEGCGKKKKKKALKESAEPVYISVDVTRHNGSVIVKSDEFGKITYLPNDFEKLEDTIKRAVNDYAVENNIAEYEVIKLYENKNTKALKESDEYVPEDEPTRVFFVKERNPWTEEDEITAVFPDEVNPTNGFVTCYAHIGQHSEGMLDAFLQCPEATEEEYASLLRELETVAKYDNLIVIDKPTEELDEGCGEKSLKESDEDMSGYEDRLNKTIKSEMKKFPKYAADAKKALDDGDEIKKILNKYNQEYNFLYNNHDKVAGYEEAVRAWDEYINHPDFRELIGKVIKARHDMFTSDREIGALMFALDALGYLDKFDGKESSLEPVVKEFKMNESEEKTNTHIVDLDGIVQILKNTKNLTLSKRAKILEPYNLTPEQTKYVLDELHGVSRGHAYLYGPSEF